ncbi:unnamed protein product [Linum trigynum]|uniref:Uncharacterized protein n=1 Tax=Linum trigynum TaxID=586398 RepID=A0AAV2DB86_9ROSI
MGGGNRWFRLEVYPLFAATGVVGICAFQLIRNISGNPEIRSTSFPHYLLLYINVEMSPLSPSTGLQPPLDLWPKQLPRLSRLSSRCSLIGYTNNVELVLNKEIVIAFQRKIGACSWLMLILSFFLLIMDWQGAGGYWY